MNTIAEKLETYKKIVSDQAQKKNIFKGKLEGKLEELKTKGFAAVEEAEIWRDKEQIELDKLSLEFEEDMAEFEKINEGYLNG